MPELPEVETIARVLKQGAEPLNVSLIGCQIKSAQVLWQRTLANLSPREFIQRITGQSVIDVSRRGKFIVVNLDHDSLLIHLRMSGDLRMEKSTAQDGSTLPLQEHDRLVLQFINQSRLAFNDTRKFGRAWLTDDPQEILAELGPEPLDESLTSESFHAMLTKHNRQLKPLLMDQRFLAGLGNIYTDEALFRASIHPLKRSGQITTKEAHNLLHAIRVVLQEGIQRNGASIDWVYRGGQFQHQFQVYGREGQACTRCGSPIRRLVVSQRGTHVCPSCQPAP